jgi:hypothetical protein
MLKLFLILFCSLTLSAASAQGNYEFEEALIVTKRGDSIRGFVEVTPNYGSKINYKKVKGDAQSFMPTKEIKFISTANRYLENVHLGKRESLMTMIADGKARLFLEVESRIVVQQSRASHYEARETPYVDRTLLFVLKKGGTYTEVTRKRYEEILSGVFFDCPDVVQKLREKAFTYEEMDKVVMYYNSCK